MSHNADGTKKKAKGRAPSHQNKFAFYHNKNSTKTEAILNIPNLGLCQTCFDIIEWKKRYRKYKPRSVPGKCTGCEEKNLVFAYHIFCQSCATQRKLCAKCGLDKKIVEDERVVALTRVSESEAVSKLMASGLREREKRSILRDLERGEITPSHIVAALDGKLNAQAVEVDEEDDEDEKMPADENGAEDDDASSSENDADSDSEIPEEIICVVSEPNAAANASSTSLEVSI